MAIETVPRVSDEYGRHPGLVPMSVVARSTRRAGLIWGAVFAFGVWMLVSQFTKEYPTAADRARLTRTMAGNVGWSALFGPVREIGTVAGYTGAHLVGVYALIGAVWGLLAATKAFRGEEEAGRWELLLAGPTTRARATASALAGLGVGWLTLWAMTAAATVGFGRSSDAGFSVRASLFAATATVAPAAMFLAVGALCSQLADNRRRAAGLAAAVLGAAYVLRLIANTATTLRWLRWLSPLGWVDELRPLTGSRTLPLLPVGGFVAALAVVTVALASRRDLGAGVVATRDAAPSRTRWLNGPVALAHRVGRGTAIGWTVGFAAGGFVVGVLAKTSETLFRNASGGVIQKLAGTTGGATYLGVVFLLFAFLVAMAAAAQVAAAREEEADGYLDNLLARPVSRWRWMAGRVAVSATHLLVFGVVAGLFTWIGATSTGAGVGFSTLIAAGVNIASAGLFVLGLGSLVHAVAPRTTVPIVYGVVAWSFLVEIVGAGIGASRWLLDTSVLHHITRAPAAAVSWEAVATLTALGVGAAVVAAFAFNRRDLQTA